MLFMRWMRPGMHEGNRHRADPVGQRFFQLRFEKGRGKAALHGPVRQHAFADVDHALVKLFRQDNLLGKNIRARLIGDPQGIAKTLRDQQKRPVALALQKRVGLGVAFLGTAWAILDGQMVAGGSLAGDLCALGASIGWAAILLVIKGSNIRDLAPEVQLFWQVFLSIPLLLVAATFFGRFVRELAAIHWLALGFQIFAIASFGFLFWFWLIKIYPATSVASFSFLSPVFSVAVGAVLLQESVGLALLGSLALVTLGLIIINRPARQVPQKV